MDSNGRVLMTEK